MGVSEGRVNSKWNGVQTHHWNGGYIPPTHLQIRFSSIPWCIPLYTPTLTWFLNRYHHGFRPRIAELVGLNTVWIWAHCQWSNIPTTFCDLLIVAKNVAYLKLGTHFQQLYTKVGLQGIHMRGEIIRMLAHIPRQKERHSRNLS